VECGDGRKRDNKLSSNNYFTIENLDQLNKAVEKMKTNGFTEMQQAVDAASEDLLEKVKAKVPHKWHSGEKLRNSLYTKRSTEKVGEQVANIITWGDDVRDYAAPLELGHMLVARGTETGIPIMPRPFMRSAFDENSERIMDFITERMNKVLDEFGE
jgi:HK97 gp10 family phage protein